MSERDEDPTYSDGTEPLTDAEARQFERDAAPYRALLAAVNAARTLAKAIGTSEAKLLEATLSDAISVCIPLSALITVDADEDAFFVRQAVEQVAQDASEARKARPVMIASPAMMASA